MTKLGDKNSKIEVPKQWVKSQVWFVDLGKLSDMTHNRWEMVEVKICQLGDITIDYI